MESLAARLRAMPGCARNGAILGCAGNGVILSVIAKRRPSTHGAAPKHTAKEGRPGRPSAQPTAVVFPTSARLVVVGTRHGPETARNDRRLNRKPRRPISTALVPLKLQLSLVRSGEISIFLGLDVTVSTSVLQLADDDSTSILNLRKKRRKESRTASSWCLHMVRVGTLLRGRHAFIVMSSC